MQEDRLQQTIWESFDLIKCGTVTNCAFSWMDNVRCISRACYDMIKQDRPVEEVLEINAAETSKAYVNHAVKQVNSGCVDAVKFDDVVILTVELYYDLTDVD
jgi:hypothetical protein